MFPSSMARHKIQMIDDHRQTKEMAYITEHSACTNGRISSLSRSLITHQLTIALLLLQHYLLFLPFFFALLDSRFSSVLYPRRRAEPCSTPLLLPLFHRSKTKDTSLLRNWNGDKSYGTKDRMYLGLIEHSSSETRSSIGRPEGRLLRAFCRYVEHFWALQIFGGENKVA